MERNKNYWNAGLPYLDGIEFYNFYSFSPELGSAVLSGRVDYVRLTDPVTLSSRASMAASATSASTSTYSVACQWHGGSLKLGGSITMPAGRTPASAVWPPTSLQPGPNWTTTRTDAGYE
jgi:hypothetical protein